MLTPYCLIPAPNLLVCSLLLTYRKTLLLICWLILLYTNHLMVKSFSWILPIPVSPSPYSLLPTLLPTPNSYSSSVPYSQLLLIPTYSLLPAHNLLLSHSFPYSPFSLLPISTLFLVTPRSLLPTYSPPVPYSWLLPVPFSQQTPYLYHTPGYSLFHSPNKLPTCTILLATPCSILPTNSPPVPYSWLLPVPFSTPVPYSWLLPVPFSPLAPYLNPTPGDSLFPSSLLLVTPCSLLSLLPTTYLNSTPIQSMFLSSHLHITPILLANTTSSLNLLLDLTDMKTNTNLPAKIQGSTILQFALDPFQHTASYMQPSFPPYSHSDNPQTLSNV